MSKPQSVVKTGRIPLALELSDFAGAIDFLIELEVAEDLVLDDRIVAKLIDGAAEEGHYPPQWAMHGEQLVAIQRGLLEARDADAQ